MTVNDAARTTAAAHPYHHRPGSAPARQARERLEHERRTRTAQLVIAENEADMHSDETTLALFDRLQQTLEEIEIALARLDAGTYGSCEDCSQPIPQGRLEILPYARRCVPCQQQRQPTSR